MHFTLLLPFLAPALLANPLPSSQERNGNQEPDSSGGPASMPHISSVSYSGTGCPSSAPGVVRSGGFAEPAFRLGEFEARVPDGAQTEHCQVHVQAAGASPGWQLGLESVTVRGHVVLDPGAAVDYYVTSFFSQDADRTVTIKGTIPNDGDGRLDRDVASTTRIPGSNIVWGPCTREGSGGDVGLLNVNFRVALQTGGGDKYAYFGRGGVDNALPAESWTYAWRRC
ncbi:hypothetical protein DL767_011141 [Monosporascus sp. MG133]|nr:hypothetical protein DL767_011141 [Monosporascus sp. MG133]